MSPATKGPAKSEKLESSTGPAKAEKSAAKDASPDAGAARAAKESSTAKRPPPENPAAPAVPPPSGEQNINVTLREDRVFPPSERFSAQGNVQVDRYAALVRSGRSGPEEYWREAALDLTWYRHWDRTLQWDPPHAQWFVGGKLNASFNCLDRHLASQPHKAALVWEGEPGEVASWTYRQLHEQVERFTAALRARGLQKGDRVAIYLPMIPEAVVAMLACARAGFTHTVIFGGFSAEALKDRIQDAQAKCVITADGGWRKGAWVKLREQVDLAVKACPSITDVVVIARARAGQLAGGPTENSASGKAPNRASDASPGGAAATKDAPSAPPSRKESAAPASAKPSSAPTESNYHEMLAAISHADRLARGQAEPLDSEHPLFILYTSGTTGKPKGIVHSTGGYLTGALTTTKQVFDLKPTDLYWCTADIGWVTGHTYVVYGPLAAGATVFLYEGAPTYPTADRMWKMIERHQISILYTAPTAIRALMKLGPELPKACDLSSLRLLGTVGEPINPEAWMWYRDAIGGGRCPIVDTYWQTETGAIVISPLPGITATKPGSATLPLPGYDVEVVDKAGNPVPTDAGGYLVIRKPWPSMARTIYGDPERFQKQYFADFAGGVYFTGDGARRDKDGYIWCLGRVDDVLNVSGHRLGTMEIESALVSHPSVAEAAVVGRPDDLKGQGIVAFVTLKSSATRELAADPVKLKRAGDELKAHVAKEIGALARPDEIRFTESLPKTRSGKIMRRLLRELAATGQVKGDTTTLEDWSVIQSLQAADEE